MGPGAPPEFTDLLHGLLAKNPAERISWPQLRVHPYWQASLDFLDLPPEPRMARFLEDSRLARRVADTRQVMSLPLRCFKHKELRV